ncbi:MAG TPA: hypothetical protein VK074_07310 [Fodinibius sp.]|nr:hypothetical protein [Fodinibius sp.]
MDAGSASAMSRHYWFGLFFGKACTDSPIVSVAASNTFLVRKTCDQCFTLFNGIRDFIFQLDTSGWIARSVIALSPIPSVSALPPGIVMKLPG